MTSGRRPSLLIVDDRVDARGALRRFIEATTPYKVYDAAGDGVSVIQKARECRADVILLHLTMTLQDSLVTASLLRGKLPHVKIVGFSTLPVSSGDGSFPATAFDAVLTRQDGLSKLVDTLKVLLPELP